MTKLTFSNVEYQLPSYTKSNGMFLFGIFIIALLSRIELNVIGRLYLVEIFFICYAIFIIPRKRRLFLLKQTKLILGLLGLWLVAQVISDMILGSIFHDYSRGWSKIILLGVNFSVLYLILVTEKRLLIFIVGVSISAVLNSIQFVDMAVIWKFGGGLGVVLIFLAFLTLYYRKHKSVKSLYLLSALLLLMFSIISIMLNSRSLAAVLFLSAVFIFIASKKDAVRGRLRSRLSSIKLFFVFIFSIFLIWIILAFYGVAAQNGWFGNEAKEKYEIQNVVGYGAWGIVLGGRSELLVSLKAISDAPVIGHGSWAKDYQYALLRAHLLEKISVNSRRVYASESDLIPSHSHVLGAWVESGFIGALFWIYILGGIIYSLSKLIYIKHFMVPLLTVIFVTSLWDILFSPFGAYRRISWALYFTLLVYSLVLIKNNNRLE